MEDVGRCPGVRLSHSPFPIRPMQLAIFSDVHANLPALEAVLRDVRRAGADEIVVGGDVLDQEQSYHFAYRRAE